LALQFTKACEVQWKCTISLTSTNIRCHLLAP